MNFNFLTTLVVSRDLPNLKDYYTKGRGENPRDVVKKIYYGGNGDYETRKEKSAALVKFYTSISLLEEFKYIDHNVVNKNRGQGA